MKDSSDYTIVVLIIIFVVLGIGYPFYRACTVLHALEAIPEINKTLQETNKILREGYANRK